MVRIQQVWPDLRGLNASLQTAITIQGLATAGRVNANLNDRGKAPVSDGTIDIQRELLAVWRGNRNPAHEAGLTEIDAAK